MGRQYGHLMKKELEDLDTFFDLIIEANEGNASTARAMCIPLRKPQLHGV